MPTLTMTIDRIEQPKEGKPSGKIIGTNGESIGAFQNKLGRFVPGRTYEIDYSTKEWNGRIYKNLEGATETEAPAPSTVTQFPGVAAAPGAGNNYRQPTAPSDSKQMFVCANLTAMIRAGKVENTKEALWGTTQMLSAVWDHTFGNSAGFHASEAGRTARG